MIDTLLSHLERAQSSTVLRELHLEPNGFSVLTLHRPSNVDQKEQIAEILEGLEQIQQHIKIVFPIHPRSKSRLKEFGLDDVLKGMPQLIIIEPLGYLDFLQLMSQAKFIITDSGGIQEETTALGIPCLTLRENTERPVTVTQGTNIVIGRDAHKMVAESMKILQGDIKKGRRPDLWDGMAAKRITEILLKHCAI